VSSQIQQAVTQWCDKCEVKPYDALFADNPSNPRRSCEELEIAGWRHIATHAAMVKQCEKCRAING